MLINKSFFLVAVAYICKSVSFENELNAKIKKVRYFGICICE